MVTIPSLDKAATAWKEADREQAFWEQHYGEYLERYPEQFVAVHDGVVVGTGVDLPLLVRILEEKGYDLRTVWLRFIATGAHRVLL